MEYTQEELNEEWRILTGQPSNEYASGRIVTDSELVQTMEFDVPVEYNDRPTANVTVAYTRQRTRQTDAWGAWVKGYLASV